jgi:hypothetical protein|tara:strand:- start:2359 stop:2772 length:414 start_codon:yes stop_codon:yes gene_type:complete
MTETDEIPDPAVDLQIALTQMKDDGTPPTGFHMMFFSEDFTMKESCPANLLLKKLGMEHNFSDTLKRQVFQLPNDIAIVSYEFAWLGGFDDIQPTLESIDSILKDQFDRMVQDDILRTHPQARLSFLTDVKPEEGEE